MVPVHVVYACRACPYGNEGKGKRTWTLQRYGKGKEQDDEGKGKRRGSTGHQYHHQDGEGKGNRTWRGHMRETIYWGTPMGKGNEQDERNAEWLWRRNLLGNREDNDEVVFGGATSSSSNSWTRAGGRGKGKGKGKGKGRGKGKGKGKEDEEMSDSDESQRLVDAWIEQCKGKGYVYP